MTSDQRKNSIMTSDDASEVSEFLSALNASPEGFVHKGLKDEQIECKLYAMGEMFWPCYRQN